MKLQKYTLLLICAYIIFLLTVLFLILQPVHAQELHGFFEIGYGKIDRSTYPRTFGGTEPNTYEEFSIMNSHLFIDFQFPVYMIDLSIFGGWETWYEYSGTSGHPFRDYYYIGFSPSYDLTEILTLYLKIWHSCNHPVFSNYNAEWWVNNVWGEDATRISAGIRW